MTEKTTPRNLTWSNPELALGRLRTSEQAVWQASPRILPQRICNAGVQAGFLLHLRHWKITLFSSN